jgi:CO dehydrogenase/acetyl-CoA synthase delta subunit
MVAPNSKKYFYSLIIIHLISSSRKNCNRSHLLVLAAIGPVANSSNSVKSMVSGTIIDPSKEGAVFHDSAINEFATGEGVRIASSVQTLDTSIVVDYHLMHSPLLHTFWGGGVTLCYLVSIIWGCSCM